MGGGRGAGASPASIWEAEGARKAKVALYKKISYFLPISIHSTPRGLETFSGDNSIFYQFLSGIEFLIEYF